MVHVLQLDMNVNLMTGNIDSCSHLCHVAAVSQAKTATSSPHSCNSCCCHGMDTGMSLKVRNDSKIMRIANLMPSTNPQNSFNLVI
jgi:hypothetical protein